MAPSTDRSTFPGGTTPTLPIIVLAAGGSSRMGSPKQLLPLAGQSLLRRAAAVAVATGCRPAVVVLGRDADALGGELAGLDLTAVHNADWSLGLGSSIRAGVAAVMSPGLAGVVVTLCDQPLVDLTAIAALIEAFHRTGAAAVAAGYAGTVGVPAVFGRAMFPALLSLDPAAGAKRLLGGPDVVAIDLPVAAVDVDTPADYQQLCEGEPPR
jgi:molybdenum cofactor cytidylyltransferase